MSKKQPNPTPTNTVITVILPEENALVRTGQIVIRRGTLATVCQFEYATLDDIMIAIESSANGLISVEQNPPPKLAPFSPSTTPAQAAATVQPYQSDDADPDEAEQETEVVEADEEAQPDSTSKANTALAAPDADSHQIEMF